MTAQVTCPCRMGHATEAGTAACAQRARKRAARQAAYFAAKARRGAP